jgi:hypothetical protein
LTPHHEAAAVENAHIEHTRFAFVVPIEDRNHRERTLAEAQTMRLVPAST